MRTAVILLAAGESRRMGAAKQLLPWGDTTLAGHAASVAAAAGLSPVVAVVGARAAEVAATFSDRVETVVNSEWPLGPGGSVAAGVRHVMDRHPHVAAVLRHAGRSAAGDAGRFAAGWWRPRKSRPPASPPRCSAGRWARRRVSAGGTSAAYWGLDPAKGAGPLIRRLAESGAGVARVEIEAAGEDVDRMEDYERIACGAEPGR